MRKAGLSIVNEAKARTAEHLDSNRVRWLTKIGPPHPTGCGVRFLPFVSGYCQNVAVRFMPP